ncbi:DUF4328 domain-containing protein [Streptomyces caatingaensis]|uniref:DUF4328 domain-containing protein n=1 Tax=Streptomyces caatingaensis TaxID=1678637 RepID=UPI000672785F|nr:DUF4328 domain-containing protein [Streptomyces caatingaensis]
MAALGPPPALRPAPPPPPAGAAVPVDLRRGVRIALTALLTLTLLALLLLAAARFQQRAALADVLAEGADLTEATARRADSADTFHASMALVAGVLGLGTLALWAAWFRRVRLNAEALAPGSHRFGSGWAAGAWFTPVVNLWFPKQIANDIWRASAAPGPQGPRPPRGLLNSWWVCALVAGAVNSVTTTAYALAEARTHHHLRLRQDGNWEHDLRGLRALAGAGALGYLLCAVTGVLALLVVRQLTRMQEERALEALDHGQPPAAYPYGPLPPVPSGPYGPAYGDPRGDPHGNPYGGNPYGPYGGNPYSGGPAHY